MKNDYFDRAELKKDLKRRTIQAGAIRIVCNSISAILTIGGAIILARMLTPEEFGLFAMVATISAFARTFVDLGLGTSTVQRVEICQGEVSTLFFINFGIGFVLMAGMAGASPVIVWFYGDARLLNICLALSVIFLFKGLTVQHQALLERQMQFGYLGLINLGSQFVSLGVAIILALRGFGIWALVWRELVVVTLYAAGVWVFCEWRPGRPRFDTQIRESIRFGTNISANNIIQYFTRNLDKVLIGRFYGPNILGLYSKAFQLAMMPIEHIRMAVLGIGLSPLSTLHNDSTKYQNFYLKSLSILSFFYMPIIMFLVIKSEELILLLLGENWLDTIPMFRFLAVAGFVRPVVATLEQVMISCGKSKRYLLWGTIYSVCTISGFFVGIKWGAMGVIYAYILTSYTLLGWSLWYCLKGTPVSLNFLLKTLMLPLVSTCCSGFALLISRPVFANMNVGISLILSILLTITIYIGVWASVPSGRNRLLEFWGYSQDLFKR